ncbi:MAG: hypothetical protein SFV81_05310 [Pirellulaceae bacterium]|nr:hypothetical protein [Pirellulaceae bacterium]
MLNAAETLKELYKTLPAIEFGSLEFKAVRQAMIELNWARTTINADTRSGTKPKQTPGVSYSTIAYSKAIERICKKHGIEH